MKIAIFMQNRPHFGATLLHIPLIYSLNRCFKDAEITLFSKNDSAKMLLSVTNISEVYVYQNKLEEIKAYRAFQADMSFNLRKNSLPVTFAILLFNHKQSYSYQNFITKHLFSKTKVFEQNRFRAQSYLDLLPQECEQHYLPAISTREKRIIIMPGGAFDWKHWEITNYLKLADRLQKNYTEYSIAFTIGEMEEHYLATIKAWPQNYTIFINEKLDKLFSLVRSADLVIANDCGPSHIAQISEVPNIILYSSETKDGYKVAQEWFREKKDSYYLLGEKSQSINSITVTSVYKKALTALHHTTQ